jgi:hypothetical protein
MRRLKIAVEPNVSLIGVSMRTWVCIVMVLFSPLAISCQCGDQNIVESVGDADFIYIGTVIESKLNDDGSISNTVVAEERLKGAPTSFSFTNETIEKSLCAQSSSVGERYIIFGRRNILTHMSACSSTQAMYLYGEEGYKKIIEAVLKEAKKS